jgi:putative heme-binding domain-containing protein
MRLAPLDHRWPIATALAGRPEFAEDRVLPLMIWYGIEPAVMESPERALAFARGSGMPKLSGFVARRFFEDRSVKSASTDQIVELLRSSRDSKFLAAILSGISEALKNVQKPTAPASWSSIGSLLAGNSDPAVSDVARELSALFGDPGAIGNLRSRVSDTNIDVESRRQALQILLRTRTEDLNPLLVKLLDNSTFAPDAIRAMAAMGDAQTPALLIGRYPTFADNETRTEVINALASRSAFATNLLAAVHRGLIPRKDVGPTQVRQLRSLKDPEIDSRLSTLWPQLDDSPSAKRELLTRYKTLLTPARLQTADPSVGRLVFKQTCALCHTLFGEGTKIGPELTGADRRNLDYLLQNILDPSAVVPENYRAWVITTKDDRVLNGILAGKTDHTVMFQTTSEKVVLQRSEIDSMTESQLSMMPEGLLQALTDQQVADLIAYLMSPGQVPMAAGGEAK